MTDWQEKFRYYTMRTNFQLALSRPMLEFLCSVADDVWWDRALYRNEYGGTAPDNFIASSHALIKRGLIQALPPFLLKKEHKKRRENLYEYRSGYRLTPAGKLVVELLKQTGLFVEQDTAIQRKAAVREMRKKRD